MGTVFVPLRSAAAASAISLMIVITNRQEYYWAEANISIPAAGDLAGAAGNYKGWIVGQPTFHLFGSTQTDTGSITIQNVSGNTVMRDAASQLSMYEWVGAYVKYILYDPASETALFTFVGSISDVEPDEEQIELSLEGFGDWSNTQAVPYNVDVTCGLTFGSQECGSTSSTPCQQTYGTCSSVERFKGVVVQWDSSNLMPTSVQIAQPPPLAAFNPSRTF
jgi:hypothetical protein